MASQHGRRPPDPRKVPKSHGKRPPAPRPHRNSGTVSPKKERRREKDACCPMVAAVRSAKQGRFRLAARYARWSVRLIAARLA